MISNSTQKMMLTHLTNEIKKILKDNFIGAYVHGSLATGDSVSSSDIDVVIVIKKDITLNEIESFQQLHHKLYDELETPWGQRLELAYVPIEIFRKRQMEPRDPPNEPRTHEWRDPSTQA